MEDRYSSEGSLSHLEEAIDGVFFLPGRGGGHREAYDNDGVRWDEKSGGDWEKIVHDSVNQIV